MSFLKSIATKVEAYNIEIPEAGSAENYKAPLNVRVDGQESEIYSLVNFVNEYLWFFIIGAAFFAVLYAGIKIIFAENKGSETIKTIAINAGVGFLLAIFSFALISIIVNLI